MSMNSNPQSELPQEDTAIRKQPSVLADYKVRRIFVALSPDGLTETQIRKLPTSFQLLLFAETREFAPSRIGYIPTRNAIGKFTSRLRREQDVRDGSEVSR